MPFLPEVTLHTKTVQRRGAWGRSRHSKMHQDLRKQRYLDFSIWGIQDCQLLSCKAWVAIVTLDCAEGCLSCAGVWRYSRRVTVRSAAKLAVPVVVKCSK